MHAQRQFCAVALVMGALGLLAGPAQAGPMIVVDEFGNGTIDGTPLTSFPAGYPFGVAYVFPPANVAPAIILLTDPGSPGILTDLITLNVIPGFLTFSSDLPEFGEPGNPADVLPPIPFTGPLPPPFLLFTEVGSETNNGLIYTPAPGDPGYFSTPTGGPTYVFISDGSGPPTTTPEPSSLALLALGGVALAGWRRWRKRQATT